jgi:FkbM family methyltransferase
MRYYSQNGEDFIISKLFGDVTEGTFLEIGCIDGRRFSNTLLLEQRGWRGMCVEAHPDYIELLKANRPNSVVVHCAVGEEDEDNVTFFANARGTLSTLDRSQEERFRRDYKPWFSGFEEKLVNKRTVSSLLDEHEMPDVDVVSLDVEGYEVECLMGLDLTRHRPKLLVVESDTPDHARALDAIVLRAGYTRAFFFAGNLYYCLQPELVSQVAGRKFHVHLTHTEHPLDADGDREVSRVIDFSRVKLVDAA